MKLINMNKWANEIIQGKSRIAIPIMTHPGIEMINKTILQAVTDGETHSKAIIALNEKYPSAAATVIMDLTVEAEAFGSEIRFTENEVPSVIGRLVYDIDSVTQLRIPSLNNGRIPEYLKANRLTAEKIQDKPILAGCIGPYSLAGRLFDMTEIMMSIYIEPDVIRLLLDKCTQFIIQYCMALKDTGVNGVIMAEPAAGLLSNADCREFSSVYIKKLVEAVQDKDFIVVLHNCGNTGHCTEAMLESGANAYHFGNKACMTETLEKCPKDVLVMGNLDPVGIFKMSTPKQVYEATRTLLEETAAYPNFILSSGCDIPPLVPANNIDAFYQALEEYNNN